MVEEIALHYETHHYCLLQVCASLRQNHLLAIVNKLLTLSRLLYTVYATFVHINFVKCYVDAANQVRFVTVLNIRVFYYYPARMRKG